MVPLVSFIIPTLNAEKYLPLCLKAIRDQDYPQNKVEIVIADGGSIDSTLKIAKKFKARVVHNTEVLHEPGKDLASKSAKGEIFFFTDADNILASKRWITDMVKPYLSYPGITGFLPQTVPHDDDNRLNRYLSHLSTDPFTWFVYQNAATPKTYGELYKPVAINRTYKVFKFNTPEHPLLGLSQGFGTVSKFKRGKMAHSDDILGGIKMIEEGGLIVYVPSARIYHYHVQGWTDFRKKYAWRVRNNLTQKISGMGLVNRQKYLNTTRQIRQMLFIPYALCGFGPTIDACRLALCYKDVVMFLHVPASWYLAVTIVIESIKTLLSSNKLMGVYGK